MRLSTPSNHVTLPRPSILPSHAPAAERADPPAGVPLPADRFLAEPSMLQSLAAIAAPGIAAVRQLWLPFVLLQGCGLAAVVGYFNVPAVRTAFDCAGAWKQATGYASSAVLMVIAGGLMPEIFKFITRTDDRSARQRLRDTTFNCGLYVFNGLFSEALYRWMAFAIGTRLTIGTIAAKVAIDQWVYTPLFSIPFMALVYTWREHRYQVRPTLQSLGVAWYISRAATLLLPCWAFWVPMTCLMYALPPSLTFVFAAFATAAAATVLIAIASRKITPTAAGYEARVITAAPSTSRPHRQP